MIIKQTVRRIKEGLEKAIKAYRIFSVYEKTGFNQRFNLELETEIPEGQGSCADSGYINIILNAIDGDSRKRGYKIELDKVDLYIPIIKDDNAYNSNRKNALKAALVHAHFLSHTYRVYTTIENKNLEDIENELKILQGVK